MTANVIEGETQSPNTVGGFDLGNIKQGLVLGLVVLVVLVVILGLVVGFNKMKGNEDEEGEEGSQTYY